jgi:hypothetical protein
MEAAMMISKSTSIQMFRFFGVLCAIVFGFMTLVGTSGEDAADALNIDFDEDASMSLNSVTVNESINTLVDTAIGDSNCSTTSIDDALDSVDIDGIDIGNAEIDSIELNGISGTYTATWTPGSVASFTCSLTITGSQPAITIAETAINGATGDLSDLLTPNQRDVINFYLSNTGEEFTYCVTCTDTELDTFSVTYDIELDVSISGTT